MRTQTVSFLSPIAILSTKSRDVSLPSLGVYIYDTQYTGRLESPRNTSFGLSLVSVQRNSVAEIKEEGMVREQLVDDLIETRGF